MLVRHAEALYGAAIRQSDLNHRALRYGKKLGMLQSWQILSGRALHSEFLSVLPTFPQRQGRSFFWRRATLCAWPSRWLWLAGRIRQARSA